MAVAYTSSGAVWPPALQIYDPKAIAVAKYELARKTSMASYAITLYQEMHGEGAEIPEGEWQHT